MKCLKCNFPVRGDAWVCDDGVVVHQSCRRAFENARAGRIHKCPLCQGEGQSDDKARPIQKRIRTGTPACAYGGCRGCPDCIEGEMTTIGYEKMVCRLCGGNGFLAREPKPIIETKIVGYET